MSTDTPELSQKDGKWDHIRKIFIQRSYADCLEQAIQYERNLSEHPSESFVVTIKDRATVFYTIAASAYGVLEASGARNQAVWDRFFHYLDRYGSVCQQAVDAGQTQGMHTAPPRALLRNALDLLCRWNPDGWQDQIRSRVTAFAAITIPEWGKPLALQVVLEKLFSERRNFEHPGYLDNTRSLAEAYLDLTASETGFDSGRAQVMNLLSDIAYFQKGKEGEQEALHWARECLKINPGDQFARMQEQFIIERQTVTEQIRRFGHDTDATIAGIIGTLELIMSRPDPDLLQEKLSLIRSELKRIQTVNRFVSGREPTFQMTDPVGPIEETAQKYRDAAQVSVRVLPDGSGRQWDTDMGYLCLAFDNLLKNAVEAFQRQRIEKTERQIQVVIDPDAQKITVTDNAGGIDPTIRSRIFEPYVSTKGIRLKTGLGLSNARMAIRDKLGGTLRLAPDQPAGGARFEIFLTQTGDTP